ncbi:MAG: OPT/YSL family transporter, partial [Alphaproteobacteria bacterium]|nr:OPT/YSL family transporter [Alphaproteobacteria bacterium]
GAAVIGPVLDLLNHAYGFPGDPNRIAIVATPLPAPQAALISTLARGVLDAGLDWSLIGIGALIGVGAVVFDEILGSLKLMRLPPLAIGIGIYLPMDATSPVVLGAVIAALYNAWIARGPDAAMLQRFGVLLASGLIVGESLLGVVNAGLIVAADNPAPLALVGADFAPQLRLGQPAGEALETPSRRAAVPSVLKQDIHRARQRRPSDSAFVLQLAVTLQPLRDREPIPQRRLRRHPQHGWRKISRSALALHEQ